MQCGGLKPFKLEEPSGVQAGQEVQLDPGEQGLTGKDSGIL